MPLLVGGCGSSQNAVPATAAAPSAAATNGAAADAVAAAQYATNRPPAAAEMICSDDLRGTLSDALNVAAVPAPQASWAGHVQTCAYTLPMGRLILSVTVLPGSTAARRQLNAMRGQFDGTNPEPGLGEQAYSSPKGVVLAVKDNMVLRVDARGLSDDLGRTHEGRTDLARVIAARVFSCWSGNS